MSSAPPPDRPETSVSEDDVYGLDPDEADTGPLPVQTPASTAAPGWGAGPADDWGPDPGPNTWAGRFDTPLTVSPRPKQRQRDPKVLYYVAGAIVALAVVAGVAFLFLRSSDDREALSAGPETSTPQGPPTPNADEQRLLRMLPLGYSPDACEPADVSNDAVAQVDCDANTDTGGPESATFALAPDKAALDAALNDVMQGAQRVNCPGNIQSPGPWRRNATPQKVAGTLFCGLQEGRPTVAWTDDARLVVTVARAGPSGPTFPELYAWWASHS
ncbi:hypothetical protein [Mycobacterium deserti]|uniref:Serine/threonine protein kinase n=1 Tax=Mycobacterium deserti TaxID=2978347 RepID=A0ABT2M6D7_9MYCO|nr:hypothetical protein [Mycobacterium deserti]MCT7657822.1 hypothetical protein [Mycobacterium deserti]